MDILAFGLGWTELLVIGVAAVLIFGRRLPEVGRDLGKGLVEFKRGLKGTREELSDIEEARREVRDAVNKAGDEEDSAEKPT